MTLTLILLVFAPVVGASLGLSLVAGVGWLLERRRQ